MNIYSKLRHLITAKAQAPAYALIERNDICVFEQEIRSAQALIKQSKLHLASVKAEIMLITRATDEQSKAIDVRELQALEALESDQALAQDIAAHIAEDEIELQDQRARLSQLRLIEQRVAKDIQRAIQHIKSHNHQLVVLKANEAHGALQGVSNQSGMSMNHCLSELKASLQGIEERQLRHQVVNVAILDVDSEFAENALDERVKSAGIRSGQHDAMTVLERLQQR